MIDSFSIIIFRYHYNTEINEKQEEYLKEIRKNDIILSAEILIFVKGGLLLKFIYPLISFLISVGMQSVLPCLEDSTVLFIFWVILYLPFTSFFYSKKFLKEGKRSIPYTLIHSFSLSFSYLMFETDSRGVALLLFLWCEVWALLGLIRKQRIPILFTNKVFRNFLCYKKCTEKSSKTIEKAKFSHLESDSHD